VSGLLAWLFGGRAGTDRLVNDAPLVAIILIVSWQWLPFADADPAHRAAIARRRTERGGRDGRRPRWSTSSTSRCRIWRPITVVILIETSSC